uniref:Macaca fascicularis brain cDNA, clone: QtrA-14755 n=1 Tax=Macaca fascicularis TaxID=9541 RepID=I7GHV5_MACFA|nr:unnamed protein product [Macaca fascicularis]
MTFLSTLFYLSQLFYYTQHSPVLAYKIIIICVFLMLIFKNMYGLFDFSC